MAKKDKATIHFKDGKKVEIEEGFIAYFEGRDLQVAFLNGMDDKEALKIVNAVKEQIEYAQRMHVVNTMGKRGTGKIIE